MTNQHGPLAAAPESTTLQALVADLDGACAGPIDGLDTAVSQALGRACCTSDLPGIAASQGHADHYARHVLHADPAGRYTLVAIVWRPGQFSSVHGHYTWCSYAVVQGCLRESSYSYVRDAALARPLHVARRIPGSTCFSHAGLDEVHCLGNDGSESAVSLHVYGVDGARVATHVNRVVRVAVS